MLSIDVIKKYFYFVFFHEKTKTKQNYNNNTKIVLEMVPAKKAF
jgi:hypothetical protein